MNTVCLIIPIHPKDYNYAERFLKSLIDYPLYKNCDIYFVFSTKNDYLLFQNKFKLYEIYKSIILEDIYGIETIAKAHFLGSSVISYKKLCAVNELYKKYDYMFVCDSEICAIQTINLLEFAQLFEKEKQFFATKSSGVNHIIQSCFKFVPTNKIKNIVDNSLYIWFNNLQCYISKTIPDFFKKINFTPQANQFLWEDFDYIIYSYYMVEYMDYEYVLINNYISHTSFLDIFPYEKNDKYFELISMLDKKYREKIIWVPYNKSFIDEFPNACLTFQLNCNNPV